MSECARTTIAVGIPTYRRGQVLLDTLRQVLRQEPGADEVIVVDQTLEHAAAIRTELEGLERNGRIRWIQQSVANAQAARNRCLLETRCDVIIFIDDDVVLPDGFIAAHGRNYEDDRVACVAGKVVSPLTPPDAGTRPVRRRGGPRFDFKHLRLDGAQRIVGVANLIGANHSVRRRALLDIGGCDENYISGVLDDVDTAVRLWKAGRIVVYDPDAWLEHIMAPTGGHGLRPNTMPLWKRYFATHYFYQRHVFPHWCFWLDIPFRHFRGSVVNRHMLQRPWLLPWATGAYWFAFTRAAVSSPRLMAPPTTAS
jgi:GT2 family glycosyltransferase